MSEIGLQLLISVSTGLLNTGNTKYSDIYLPRCIYLMCRIECNTNNLLYVLTI